MADAPRSDNNDSSRDSGDERSEITQADTRAPDDVPESAPPESAPAESAPTKTEVEARRVPRPSAAPGRSSHAPGPLLTPSKPPPYASARPGPLPPPPERPPSASAPPPRAEPSPSVTPPKVSSKSESHAVAAPDLKDATEPEPEGPPIQSVTAVPVRELELMRSELAALKAQTQKQSSLLRASIPYVVLALGATSLGYLLGDTTATRRRSEVRKAAMERYFALESRGIDDQKDALDFIRRELGKDDAELRVWADTQVSVLEERLAARGEREAALKSELEARAEELARSEEQLRALEAENKTLGDKILAYEVVQKKLDELKAASIVLAQAKTNIERLSKRLSEIEETPEAKKLSD
jgi:hypothetical protein